jgi:hypothetical protein
MSIRNYTSEIPASRSIASIMQRLVDHGASEVAASYVDKRVVGLVFVIPGGDSKHIPIRLPARSKQIAVVLRRSYKKVNDATAKRIEEQAERTAWKLLDEWIQIQLNLIQLEQIEFLEAFLPFVWNPALEKTFFERVKEGGMLALTEGER